MVHQNRERDALQIVGIKEGGRANTLIIARKIDAEMLLIRQEAINRKREAAV